MLLKTQPVFQLGQLAQSGPCPAEFSKSPWMEIPLILTSVLGLYNPIRENLVWT